MAIPVPSLSSGQPSLFVLDRRLLPGLTVECALWAVLVLVAGLLRFWDLGSRALHHDESLHAFFSWQLAEGHGYRHDPLMHGPFQFHAIALIFRLLGDSDATARLLAALLGTGAVAALFLFRPYLGRLGALAAALMLTISPGMLYYSRFARNDILMVFWSLLWTWGLWRYRDTGQSRYFMVGTAALALSFATKETVYITFAVFSLYLVLHTGPELLRWLRSGLSLALSPTAQAFWAWGTIALPFFVAGLSPWLRPRGLSPSADAAALHPLDPAAFVPALLVALAFAVSLVLGLMSRPGLWLRAAALFWGIEVLLYTTFFTNPIGFATGVWGSLDYWLQQHAVQRGSQPWYYYGVLLGLYEFLPVVLALAALPRLLREREPFMLFTAWWALGALIAYSYAGEKMPWLSLHITLPCVLLAAASVERFGTSLSNMVLPPADTARSLWRMASTVLTALVLFVLVVFTALTALRATFVYGDIPYEPLVYVQTSPDVPRLARRIADLAAATGLGHALPITVDGYSGFTWPWAWYLRHYTQVSYPVQLTGPPAGQMVVLIHEVNVALVEKALIGYERVPYRLRWWFPEVYRELTPKKVAQGLMDPAARGRVMDYILFRRLPEPLGSEDGVAFFASAAGR